MILLVILIFFDELRMGFLWLFAFIYKSLKKHTHLSWLGKNISRIKKFWIYTPNFKIQITVPRVPSVSQRSDLGRWPSDTFLFVSSRSTKWAIYTNCGLRFFFVNILMPSQLKCVCILLCLCMNANNHRKIISDS